MSSTTIPEWVRKLVGEHGGSDPWFITTKTLTSSDRNFRNQNRLLIPSQDVNDNLIPMLSEAEKTAASLHPTSRRISSNDRAQGREHGGLDVYVCSRNGYHWNLKLTCWDTTRSTVIKGQDYKAFMIFGTLQVNDKVELWGFRQGEEGKLCFALGKKTVS
ncbi:B3 domain-containing protein At2g31420-like [Phoenix dactylifera]|uniref:B3 domain-containing protein At2g31420-like n=1 Tax=Phoenix dactylifera TaxID=42345 RepID=A0A8B9ASY0_PHODC|nr:B3 domain-containing protein At2g31420-like [Phoenix dactylifera]